MENSRSFDAGKLAVGSVIQYVLPLSQRPADPNRLWRGKVTYSHSDRCLFVVVSSLEPGYEGLVETVFIDQIVRSETNGN